MYTVYGLVCPLTYYVRYVGVTSKHVEVRLHEHMQCSNGSLQKVQWLKTLVDLNLTPTIIILGYAKNKEQAYDVEKSWIIKGFSYGWPLTNGDNKDSEQDDTKTYPVPENTRDQVVVEKLKLRCSTGEIVRECYGVEGKGKAYQESVLDLRRIISERIK